MIQALSNPVTFDEFIDWYPENSGEHYELHRGVIVEMPKPTGKHSKIAGFLTAKLNIEIDRLGLPFFIPKECLVKSFDETGYEPDVIVLDEPSMTDEPRWERESVITKGSSVRLTIEVVSTNWRDDYHLKFSDYEALSITEYWIVDYLGLGGRRYIGSPKQPTFSVCTLVDGEYELQKFRGSDRILSPTFPSLELTVEQVFSTGRS